MERMYIISSLPKVTEHNSSAKSSEQKWLLAVVLTKKLLEE